MKPELRLTEHITISLTKRELKRVRLAAARDGLAERPWAKQVVMAAVTRSEQEDDGDGGGEEGET